MAPDTFTFEGFHLDPTNRHLRRGDKAIKLNGRYLDALVLLVRERGQLVSKDRFLDEVWRGVPVTDEALTQCIRSIRMQLGDDAGQPRFIETVPKHGYRFIATVTSNAPPASPASIELGTPSPSLKGASTRIAQLTITAALGGAAAGSVGGLLYGFGFALAEPAAAMGAASIVLVVTLITGLVGLAGGAGVGLGVAVASFAARRRALWSVIGGASGGVIVGAVAKLLGLDAFELLLGQPLGDITGAGEGLVLGGAVGLGAWLATCGDPRGWARTIFIAAWTGGLAGVVVALCGSRLMAGSLGLLASRFPASRLDLNQVGAVFGEAAFGPLTKCVTAGLEGGLFSAGVVGMLHVARIVSTPRLNH
jgi:DNA-binding winged helix-turn-helix (wHTH) protein